MGQAGIAAALSPMPFDAVRLERVFAVCFSSLMTRLEGGAEEPLYRPAQSPGDSHVLFYRADYFASALHEVGHWCIAGEKRREQVDFGYWYAPDGRSAQQQRAFEDVECKPQALEWLFSRACRYRFQISVDNLDQGVDAVPDTRRFQQRVHAQVLQWQTGGLPARAQCFFQALCQEFDTTTAAGDLDFSLAELR